MSSASEQDSTVSVDCDDGSNNDLTVSTHLEYNDGTVPLVTKAGSGRMSPIRARTMKEYDQQIAELQKENFSLKLRIYFLEERMKNQLDGDADDVFRQNIELKVEVESLKKDLLDKQELLKKSYAALTSVSHQHQVEIQQVKELAKHDAQQGIISETQAVKMMIEDLKIQLNAKNEEVDKFHVQSKETESKLNELLSMNRQLDSRWRKAEREKKEVEMLNDVMMNGRMDENETMENSEGMQSSVVQEVVRKERLIEQLRCALKAKDIIIEQVEEEKKEAIKETALNFEKKLIQLEANGIRLDDDDNAEYFMESGQMQRKVKVTEKGRKKELRRINERTKEEKSVQTMNYENVEEMESLNEELITKREELETQLLQNQLEKDRLKKQMKRKEEEFLQLVEQFEKSEKASIKKEEMLKELRNSIQDERQKNGDRLLELDNQYKSLLDDANHHSSNQDQTILRLTQTMKTREQQIQDILNLSTISDELMEDNNESLKKKDDEINHLKNLLHQQIEESEKELSVFRQTISRMKNDSQLTDKTLYKLSVAFKDQQMELDESESHHDRDLFNRETLIQRLRTSIVVKNQLLEDVIQTEPISLQGLVSDLRHQLTVKDDLLQELQSQLSSFLNVELLNSKEKLHRPRKHDDVLNEDEKTMSSEMNVDEVEHLQNEISHLRALLEKGRTAEAGMDAGMKDTDAGVDEKTMKQLERISSFVDGMKEAKMEEVKRGIGNIQHSLSPLSSDLGRQSNNIARRSLVLQMTTEQSDVLPTAVLSMHGSTRGHSPVKGQSPLPTISSNSPRISPSRSNISYLSVESSKRQDSLEEGWLGNWTGQTPSAASFFTSFEALLPDDEILSQLSTPQLKNIITNIRKRTSDQYKALQHESQGTSPVRASANGSDWSMKAGDHLLVVSVESQTDIDNVEPERLKKKAEKWKRENSSLKEMLDHVTSALRSSENAVQSLESEVESLNQDLESMRILNAEVQQQMNTTKEENVRFHEKLDSSFDLCRKFENSLNHNEAFDSTRRSNVEDLRREIDSLRDENCRLEKDFETVNGINDLLKEQIKLNSRSSLGFNPDLIVEMAKEIDKMKKELAMKNFETSSDRQMKMKEIDRVRSTKLKLPMRHGSTTDEFRHGISTDEFRGKIRMEIGEMDVDIYSQTKQTGESAAGDGQIYEGDRSGAVEPATSGGHRKMGGAEMEGGHQRKGHMETDEGRWQTVDNFLSLQRVATRTESGNSLTRQSSSSSTEGRKRSKIPVFQRNGRSQSMESMTTNDGEINIIKCMQLETRMMMMQAMIDSQSQQIDHYKKLLQDKRQSSPDRLSSVDILKRVEESSPLDSSKQDGQMKGKDVERKLKDSEWQRRSTNDIAYKLPPSGDHEVTFDSGNRSGFYSSGTPFDDTRFANRQAFIQLEEEVKRLKTQLEMSVKENSRLNDTMLIYKEEEALSSSVNVSMSGHGTSSTAVAVDYLRRLVTEQRHDNDLLQCNLLESQTKCDILITRLEELSEFLEELLPLIETATPLKMSGLKDKLNSTRYLILDLSQSLTTTYDYSNSILNRTGTNLSRLELDSTVIADDADQRTSRNFVIQGTSRSSMQGTNRSLIQGTNGSSKARKDGPENISIRRDDDPLLHPYDEDDTKRECYNKELEQRLHKRKENETTKDDCIRCVVDDELRMSLREEKEKCLLMKTELLDLQSSNQHLRQTLEECRHRMDDLDKMNHHLQVTLVESNTKVNSIEVELVESRSERIEEKESFDDIAHEQTTKISILEEERELLMHKIEMLSIEIRELRIEVIRERERSVAMETTNGSHAERLEDKDGMIRKLKELLKENQLMAENLRLELHRLNEDIQEKKLTINRLNKRCQELQNSVKLSESTKENVDSFSDVAAGMCVETEPSTDDARHHSVTLSSGRLSHRSNVSQSHISDGLHLKTTYPDRDLCNSMDSEDFLDQRPTRDVANGSHLGFSSLSSGITIGGPLDVGSNNKMHDMESNDVAGKGITEIAILESRLTSAENMNSILQSELNIYERMKEGSVYVEGRYADDENSRLDEHLEEIRKLRKRLEESLTENEGLRKRFVELMEKQTDGSNSFTSSNTSLEIRFYQLQTELNEKIRMMEAEKNSNLQALHIARKNLDSATIELKRLKETSTETLELNRTLKLELKLHEMMTQSSEKNKENERLRSSGGTEMLDLTLEIRQLRIQMEKTIENNNALRRKLEEHAWNQMPNEKDNDRRSASPGVGSSRFTFTSNSVNQKDDSTRKMRTDDSDSDKMSRSHSQPPPVDRHKITSNPQPPVDRHNNILNQSNKGLGCLKSFVDYDGMYLIVDFECYEKLKTEIASSQTLINRIETLLSLQKLNEETNKNSLELIGEMRNATSEEEHLVGLFSILDLSKQNKNTSDKTRLIEIELLRRQLSDLKQRYARAKQAMKGAQERLEANNKKKEEFLMSQKNKKEQAIIDQISKTHQILTQARQNMEAVHHSGDRAS